MNITNKNYFTKYQKLIGHQIGQLIKDFGFEKINGNLGYHVQASAVYSSNIEGNSIDLNSFMNYKLSKQIKHPQKEIQEIENLIAAYEFAQNNVLTENNLLNCHKIFSKTLVSASNRGKFRNEKVGVFGQDGLVYLAVEQELVKENMSLFFKEINELLNTDISTEEVFYFASFIHLVFAHIHPFRDGNGRAARLIEKWFLTQKLGDLFWNIPSEKYYKENKNEYYKNINLGVNFYELNYDTCIHFLSMLPKCLEKF